MWCCCSCCDSASLRPCMIGVTFQGLSACYEVSGCNYCQWGLTVSRCTMYLPSATMRGDGHPAPDVQGCRAFDISVPCPLTLQNQCYDILRGCPGYVLARCTMRVRPWPVRTPEAWTNGWHLLKGAGLEAALSTNLLSESSCVYPPSSSPRPQRPLVPPSHLRWGATSAAG